MSGCRISRARRAPEAEAGVARRHVLDAAPSRPPGACARIQARSWRPNAVPGDDPEAVLGEPRDREVALDPAALVQHLRVGDRADVAARRGCRTGARGSRRAPGPTTSILANDVSSKSAARLAAGAVLGADRGRPELARPSRAGAATRRRAAAFGSNQFARSQPDFSPNDGAELLRAARRSARAGAAGPASRSWPGYLTS